MADTLFWWNIHFYELQKVNDAVDVGAELINLVKKQIHFESVALLLVCYLNSFNF